MKKLWRVFVCYRADIPPNDADEDEGESFLFTNERTAKAFATAVEGRFKVVVGPSQTPVIQNMKEGRAMVEWAYNGWPRKMRSEG